MAKPLGAETDGFDITQDSIAPGALGASIVHCLGVKGYCHLNPGISPELLEKALEDVGLIESQSRFAAAPELVLSGLLGPEGSAQIAELSSPDSNEEEPLDGQHIRNLDMALSHTGLLVLPYVEELGIDIKLRTPGLLHRAGPPELAVLNEKEAARWLSIFANHKLMLIWILGPDAGMLELAPYGCEANPQRLKVEPGCMIILRPDTLGHILTCLGKCYCLSCFYWGQAALNKRRIDEEQVTPAAKALEEWAEGRLREIKEMGADAVPLDLPRRWELKMNHTGFTGQQVAVSSTSGRFPSCWDYTMFYESLRSGADYGIEVPLMRWDHQAQIGFLDQASESAGTSGVGAGCRHSMFIDGVDLFDHTRFRLSFAEASGMDPGQRHLLEVGYETLLSCGITQAKMRNSRGAIMCSASNLAEWTGVDKSQMKGGGGVCGVGNNIAAGRFSFVHGLKGPCISFDQENAGSLVAMQYGATVISRLGTWEPAPWSLVYSYHLVLAPLIWWHFAKMGSLAPKGRCFSFDASADGFVRSETVSAVCLKPMLEDVKGKSVLAAHPTLEAVIAGAHVNQNGKRASVTAPDGAAEQACAYEAIRAADISPLDVDAVECHAAGSIIGDAIEVASMSRACRPDGMIGLDEACTLNLMSQKTSWGNCMDASGLVQVMKVAAMANWGAMDPAVHTRLLNPHIDLVVCERPAMIATEITEFLLPFVYVGIFGRNMTGTNVHMVLWGSQDAQKRAAASKPVDPPHESLSFWPAGGGQTMLQIAPTRGYYIRGTWSGMELELMEYISPGEYGFTFTMGSNGWEQFNILVDGDSRKVIHPSMENAPKGAKAFGPEGVEYFSCWLVNGLQEPLPFQAEDTAVVSASKEISSQIIDGPEVPTFYPGDEDIGEPGDQYKVNLIVSGQWRLVSWQKLTARVLD